MTEGKVLTLYMTLPDTMRLGNREECDSFECDEDGIFGDTNYESDGDNSLLLVSKISYDLIKEAESFIDKGFLLENIYIDIDLNHLTKGTILKIGQSLFEVNGPCEAYGYLYKFAPEVPEIIQGKRGIFITPVDHGIIEVGDTIEIVK